MERIEIRSGYSVSKVIKGGWHLAGGHGKIDQKKALLDMYDFVKAGITTFDCADIYTGVEELIGKFREKYQDEFRAGDLPQIQIHTKYVPDYSTLATLKKEDVVKTIDRSLKRLKLERLDLVQFAWWDYQFPKYIDTALHLSELQKNGKIRYIGITNFDSRRIRELLDAGLDITTNQVQYSLLDRRVEKNMTKLAKEHNIPFLCYGSVAGGFLSDRYFEAPDPKKPLENRSLTKYRLIIDEFGGYNLFQELLKTLKSIGKKYNVGIAEIACKYVLQKLMVASIIVGARNNKHLHNLKKLNHFSLDNDDLKTINKIITLSKGPLGSFYELERDKNGPHGSIMKYNLNNS